MQTTTDTNMDYKELIAKRHSVRSFTEEAVPRDVLDSLVDDALLAPSSKNTRSSGFMIVEDKSTLEAMSSMRTRGSAFLSGAAAAIVVLGDTSKTDLWVENASISATYLMMSAVDRGLGSCWIHVNGRLRDQKDPDSGKASDFLRDLLGIRDGMEPLCIIALGYEKI